MDSVILFDCVCNLCNSLVNFIIKRDYNNRFKFCTIQSETGQTLLKQFGLNTSPQFIILIERNKYYQKSTAVLKIVKELRGWVKILYPIIIIPPFIRNIFYYIIAKNRYRWFEKLNKCMVPTDEIKSKFIE